MICPSCGRDPLLGEWPFDCKGHGHTLSRSFSSGSKVHSSERAVIYRNPQTGEVRVPGRADRPIHPKYQAAGFTERVELDSGPKIRKFEKETGLIHESSNYDSGSATAEHDTGSA
jgi:hypothetical protein